MNNQYIKFALMMTVSFVIMYAVMFLNADVWDHVMLSTTRTYMTILMIAPMAISMMLFMWGMYKNKALNYIILGVAALIFVATFTMLRQQTLISDVQWMKAMIPHHSSAIMVSQKAHLKDPEAIKLAEEIIEAQEREIAQMKKMIYRLESRQ
jgi:uncharacterized protein (DUF305 family)